MEGTGCGFWLLDNDLVRIETYSAELNLRQTQEIELYSGIFERVRSGVTLLSRERIEQLPERAREVVEYRKSGLSLNHIQGCPLEEYVLHPAYHGLWDQRQPCVRPGKPIKHFATRIHGLTNDAVADAPAFAAIKDDEVLDTFEGAVLVAHNAHVDMAVSSANSVSGSVLKCLTRSRSTAGCGRTWVAISSARWSKCSSWPRGSRASSPRTAPLTTPW